MTASSHSLFVLAATLAIGGCAIAGSINEATATVDRGIEMIDENSAQWQSALRYVSNELPDRVDASIRNEATTLAQRSVAGGGEVMQCSVDFLARRARQALVGLRNAILAKRPPAQLPPVFCAVTPGQIEVGLDPARWPTITFSGYDLDHRDAQGRMLQVVLVDSLGRTTPVDESLVNRTTHYRMTLNLANPALRCQLAAPGMRKVATTFSGTRMGEEDGQGEVAIVPWTASEHPAVAHLGRTSHTPERTRGDGDFDTDDDDPMEVSMRAELRVRENEIQSRVYLRAHEPRPDHTTAEGWSEWASAWRAPDGYRIVSVTPNAGSSYDARINAHGSHTFGRPGGEAVSQFRVWGDHDGDEAGSWTHVEVDWRNLEVRLRETRPRFLQCPAS